MTDTNKMAGVIPTTGTQPPQAFSTVTQNQDPLVLLAKALKEASIKLEDNKKRDGRII